MPCHNYGRACQIIKSYLDKNDVEIRKYLTLPIIVEDGISFYKDENIKILNASVRFLDKNNIVRELNIDRFPELISRTHTTEKSKGVSITYRSSGSDT